jgi:hypothetical protein
MGYLRDIDEGMFLDLYCCGSQPRSPPLNTGRCSAGECTLRSLQDITSIGFFLRAMRVLFWAVLPAVGNRPLQWSNIREA